MNGLGFGPQPLPGPPLRKMRCWSIEFHGNVLARVETIKMQGRLTKGNVRVFEAGNWDGNIIFRKRTAVIKTQMRISYLEIDINTF